MTTEKGIAGLLAPFAVKDSEMGKPINSPIGPKETAGNAIAQLCERLETCTEVDTDEFFNILELILGCEKSRKDKLAGLIVAGIEIVKPVQDRQISNVLRSVKAIFEKTEQKEIAAIGEKLAESRKRKFWSSK